MKKLLLVVLMAISIPALAQDMEKNGTIYKKHPLIDVNNAIGALYQKGDAAGMAKYYADTAKFYSPASEKPGTLTEAKAAWQHDFDTIDQLKLTLEGYPDGLEYAKDGFMVQTWFKLTGINKKTKKPVGAHMVLFLTFNKDGKVATSAIYFDPTSFIAAEQ
jgi:hypothetical protein